MAGIGIIGWGMCVPEQRLTNEELGERFGVDDEWIMRRTGIRERRIVSAGDRDCRGGERP